VTPTGSTSTPTISPALREVHSLVARNEEFCELVYKFARPLGTTRTRCGRSEGRMNFGPRGDARRAARLRDSFSFLGLPRCLFRIFRRATPQFATDDKKGKFF
jgi:hypothetical protein